MAVNDAFLGAALRYVQKMLGGSIVETVTNVSLGTTSSTIAKGNGDRVALVVFNSSNSDISIMPILTPTALIGLTLGAAGGMMSLSVRDDFTLPSQEWHGISPAPAQIITVIEYCVYNNLNAGTPQ